MPRPSLSPLLHLLVASALPTFAGCGLFDRDPTPMPEAVPCPDFAGANRYAALTLAPGVDGIVLRAINDGSFTASGSSSAETASRGTLGEPCRTARDRAACQKAVSAASSAAGWSYGPGGMQGAYGVDYGVVTRGDDVRLVTTYDELRPLVAPVEAASEALALLYVAGHRASCYGNNARTEADGWVFQNVRGGCGGPEYEDFYKVDREGHVTRESSEKLGEGDPNCMEGRRPAGFVREGGGGSWLETLPAHLAEIAHMEAAAVVAFEDLERHLRRHGAPRALLERIEESRADEVVHAAIFRELAEALGARVDVVRVRTAGAPDLLALAVDNAVEGCAREAYGALVALHQAKAAADPTLRAAFARIAEDEARHAALSFDLAVFYASRLGPAERELVARAHASALRELGSEVRHEPGREVRELAGMPSARAARRLVAGLARTLPLPRAA